jgi:hypothetical protein
MCIPSPAITVSASWSSPKAGRPSAQETGTNDFQHRGVVLLCEKPQKGFERLHKCIQTLVSIGGRAMLLPEMRRDRVAQGFERVLTLGTDNSTRTPIQEES